MSTDEAKFHFEVETLRKDAQHLATIVGAMVTAYYAVFADRLKELPVTRAWWNLVPVSLWSVALVGYLVVGLHTSVPFFSKNQERWRQSRQWMMNIAFTLFIFGLVFMLIFLFIEIFVSVPPPASPCTPCPPALAGPTFTLPPLTLPAPGIIAIFTP